VLHQYGGLEKLKFEDNVPEPQISGSMVLIAAAAASVNPINCKLRSGMRPKNSPLFCPAILGPWQRLIVGKPRFSRLSLIDALGVLRVCVLL
jgi:hypothetical protein